MTQIPIGRPSDEDSQEVSAALAEKFSKPLKKQITGLIRRQRDELLHPELASDYIFPVLPGVLSDPNEEKRNPVLELVKLLMQVLSLSKITTMETRPGPFRPWESARVLVRWPAPRLRRFGHVAVCPSQDIYHALIGASLNFVMARQMGVPGSGCRSDHSS